MMSNGFLDNMASNSAMFDINDYVFRCAIITWCLTKVLNVDMVVKFQFFSGVRR